MARLAAGGRKSSGLPVRLVLVAIGIWGSCARQGRVRKCLFAVRVEMWQRFSKISRVKKALLPEEEKL